MAISTIKLANIPVKQLNRKSLEIHAELAEQNASSLLTDTKYDIARKRMQIPIK